MPLNVWLDNSTFFICKVNGVKNKRLTCHRITTIWVSWSLVVRLELGEKITQCTTSIKTQTCVGWLFWVPQNHNGCRSITLGPKTIQKLREQLKRQGEERETVGTHWKENDWSSPKRLAHRWLRIIFSEVLKLFFEHRVCLVLILGVRQIDYII